MLKPSVRRLTGACLVFLASIFLTACILTSDQAIESNPKDPRAPEILDRIRALDLTPRALGQADAQAIGRSRSSSGAVYLGNNGAEAALNPNTAGAVPAGSGSGFDLNFENAPVASVAKVVIGDILGATYTIDPRVVGNVTLASGRPVAKSDVLFVLENALRMSNVALARDRTGYRLIPAGEALGSGGIDRAAMVQAGFGLSVLPLQFVSAPNMLKLLDGFGVRANTIRADATRNLLVIQGTGTERRSAMETAMNFDADWMRGQSIGIFRVKNSTPEPLISEIERIMDAGEGGLGSSMVKLTPISRMNSILVVSAKPEYLKTAGTWISRLDKSDTEATNLKVYQLRYGNARPVAALLNEVLTGRAGGGPNLDSASNQIAPGGGLSVSSSGTNPLAALSALPSSSNTSGGASSSGSPSGGAAASNGRAAAGAVDSTQAGAAAGGIFGANGRPSANVGFMPNVRITPDVTNNSILVYANAEAQHIVEMTLRQIDKPQLQVAIEATIAEVTLNDQLQYGVQFYLTSANVGAPTNTGSLVNTIGSAALSRVLPGFNALIGSEATPQVILNALHNITDVKVLSNPSLVVLNNEVATLQVGDQVPITTGNATVLTANNTVVNTISYLDTGIILRVKPRVSSNGNVVVEIEQEISNASSTTTLTPTISQRKVKSSISVASGQTVLLAGLISENQNKTRQGIPLLDQIPSLGDAFANTNITKMRTELILFIRPSVIKDAVDAHFIAEELRAKLGGRLIGTSIPMPVIGSPKSSNFNEFAN